MTNDETTLQRVSHETHGENGYPSSMLPERDDDVDEPQSIDEGNASNSMKQCFSLIQQRRFWLPFCDASISLCPSMDLISFGTTQQKRIDDHNELHQTQSQGSEEANATRLHLHRTVNWQKLATLEASTAAGLNLGKTQQYTHVVWRPDGRFLAIADNLSRVSLYSVEDILNNNNNSNNGGMSDTTVDNSGGDDADVPGKVHTITIPFVDNQNVPTTITGLAWEHIGKPHPAWSTIDNDDCGMALGDYEKFQGLDALTPLTDVDIMWHYRSQFVDREKDFLPPSEYHKRSHLISSTAEPNSPLPTCQTPLSVLYIVTTEINNNIDDSNDDESNAKRTSINSGSYLYAYLHGRYPILLHLKLGSNWQKDSSSIVASADMAHIMIAGQSHSSTVTLYSVPALSTNRYTFQQIATLYSKITAHTQIIQNYIDNVLASYKSSLKPLDLKLDALFKLLQNYGLIDRADESGDSSSKFSKMKPLLVQYILSGHTHRTPDLSNAIDQFFTSVQMNDQLLIRMERSLLAAVSNVERSFKQNLLAPALALHYAVDVLHGLGRYRSDIFASSTTDMETAPALQQLMIASELLVISIETAVTGIIDARFRLRDFVAWLRSTGAHIKARGTPPKSVQRENARKRRVPDVLVRRMLSYLQKEEIQQHNETYVQDKLTSASSQSTPQSNASLTEIVLSLKVSSLFLKSAAFVTFGQAPSNSMRPVLDNIDSNLQVPDESQLHSDEKDQPIPSSSTNVLTSPTIPFALTNTIKSAEKVFKLPQLFLSKTITCTNFLLQQNVNDGSPKRKVAITTRLGRGGSSQLSYYGESEPEGFFLPVTSNEADVSDGPNADAFRQWSVVGQVSGDHNVTLHALPLKWNTTTDIDDLINEDYEADVDNEHADHPTLATKNQWTCLLSFPEDCTIHDIAFYGDNGKSSLLSSTVEGIGQGQEGRQQLGVLLSRPMINSTTQHVTSKLEIWLLSYDSLPYYCSPISCAQTNGRETNLNSFSLSCPSEILVPTQVYALSDELDDEQQENQETSVGAKTRVLSQSVSEEARCRLVLCGSRGIGAVYVFENQHGTVLELLDLEEDEEQEESEGANNDQEMLSQENDDEEAAMQTESDS